MRHSQSAPDLSSIAVENKYVVPVVFKDLPEPGVKQGRLLEVAAVSNQFKPTAKFSPRR